MRLWVGRVLPSAGLVVRGAGGGDSGRMRRGGGAGGDGAGAADDPGTPAAETSAAAAILRAGGTAGGAGSQAGCNVRGIRAERARFGGPGGVDGRIVFDRGAH